MRKQPRQQRSRDLVERIVRAARQVLIDDGYDAFSTNRVAAACRISPGSLYQYFDDKAAILELVVDRYVDETAEQVVASLGDRVGPMDAPTVRAIADALLHALESDPALLRVVHEQLPARRLIAQRRQLERQVSRIIAAVLASSPSGARAATRAWFVVMSVEHLAVRWVLDEPDLGRDEFLDELTRLVAGYLAGGGQ